MLTAREIEILQAIANGRNSREIAATLQTSYGTIKWYRRELYRKLDAHQEGEAVAIALRNGIIH